MQKAGAKPRADAAAANASGDLSGRGELYGPGLDLGLTRVLRVSGSRV